LAAKNAILIVEFARQAEEREGVTPVQAAIEAARTRLRPILMTSAAFIFGVIPLAFGSGPGAELRQALGVAVFWGMIGVTLFGLVFTPVFYILCRKLAGLGHVPRVRVVGVNALFVACCAGLAMHSGIPDARAAQTEQQLDEAIVRGKKIRAAELRRQMVELEDQFFAKYNELNDEDEFDVHCHREARIGSRLLRRTCRGVYEDNARQEEGREAFLIRQEFQNQASVGAPPRLAASPPVPAADRIEVKRPAFQANVRRVVGKSRVLSRMLRERAELTEEYNALRKRNPAIELEEEPANEVADRDSGTAGDAAK
jgi:hypothetical protein